MITSRFESDRPSWDAGEHKPTLMRANSRSQFLADTERVKWSCASAESASDDDGPAPVARGACPPSAAGRAAIRRLRSTSRRGAPGTSSTSPDISSVVAVLDGLMADLSRCPDRVMLRTVDADHNTIERAPDQPANLEHGPQLLPILPWPSAQKVASSLANPPNS